MIVATRAAMRAFVHHFDVRNGDIIVITGTAAVSDQDLPSDQIPEWVDKYRDLLARLGMTAKQSAASASIPVRIRPLTVRYAPIRSSEQGISAGEVRPGEYQGCGSESRRSRTTAKPPRTACSSRSRLGPPSDSLGTPMNRLTAGFAAIINATSRSTWSMSLITSGRALRSLPRSRTRTGAPCSRFFSTRPRQG